MKPKKRTFVSKFSFAYLHFILVKIFANSLNKNLNSILSTLAISGKPPQVDVKDSKV